MCDHGVSHADSRSHSERQACYQANLLALMPDTHEPQTRLESLVAHQSSGAPALMTALISPLLTAEELKCFTVL